MGNNHFEIVLEMGNNHFEIVLEMGNNQPSMSTPAVRTFSQTTWMQPLVQTLHLAVMQNDVPRLRMTISLGVDVNQPWTNPSQPSAKDGCTPLSESVSLNHVGIAKCLIDSGALLNVVDKDGLTPLMKSAYHGRWRIAQMLNDAGADVSVVDSNGNSALHICCKNGFVHNSPLCVLCLINCGSEVNQPNKCEQIPLHYATAWSTDQIVAILLAAGADRDAVDNEYLTPLYHSMRVVMDQERRQPDSLLKDAFKRQLPILKVLLRAECDSLGLASWLRVFPRCVPQNDPELETWLETSTPEPLKNLCREHIQNRLGFTSVRHKYCVRKVQKLDIPSSLKAFLCRRLLLPVVW